MSIRKKYQNNKTTLINLRLTLSYIHFNKINKLKWI